MPKFNFELQAPIDSASAYSKIKNLLQSENDFKRFDPKVACTFDEAGKKCVIKGSQFNAELQVKTQDATGSLIVIAVDLPLALSLFKGKIKEVLEKNLKKILV